MVQVSNSLRAIFLIKVLSIISALVFNKKNKGYLLCRIYTLSMERFGLKVFIPKHYDVLVSRPFLQFSVTVSNAIIACVPFSTSTSAILDRKTKLTACKSSTGSTRIRVQNNVYRTCNMYENILRVKYPDGLSTRVGYPIYVIVAITFQLCLGK